MTSSAPLRVQYPVRSSKGDGKVQRRSTDNNIRKRSGIEASATSRLWYVVVGIA
ncbi:hypothetical protein HYS48_01270 [Candidatus Woesearchaeota archaeon]|nr:hypothetical protein [Candidatus Woesearchaeota archaeon]